MCRVWAFLGPNFALNCHILMTIFLSNEKKKTKISFSLSLQHKILINSNFDDEKWARKKPSDQTENCNTRKRTYKVSIEYFFRIYTWHRSKSKGKKMRFIMYADHFDIITKRSFDHAFCRNIWWWAIKRSHLVGAPSNLNKWPFRFYTDSVIWRCVFFSLSQKKFKASVDFFL